MGFSFVGRFTPIWAVFLCFSIYVGVRIARCYGFFATVKIRSPAGTQLRNVGGDVYELIKDEVVHITSRACDITSTVTSRAFEVPGIIRDEVVNVPTRLREVPSRLGEAPSRLAAGARGVSSNLRRVPSLLSEIPSRLRPSSTSPSRSRGRSPDEFREFNPGRDPLLGSSPRPLGSSSRTLSRERLSNLSRDRPSSSARERLSSPLGAATSGTMTVVQNTSPPQPVQIFRSESPRIKYVQKRCCQVSCCLLCVHIVAVIPSYIFGTFAGNIGPNYPIELLSLPGGFVFRGVAWHCYGGDPSAMKVVADHFKQWNLEQHLSECSGGGWEGSWWDRLKDTQFLIINGGFFGGQSFLRWNLALDGHHGPGCFSREKWFEGWAASCCRNCDGVLSLDRGSRFELPSYGWQLDRHHGCLGAKDCRFGYGVDFYGLAHHSAFFEPGAHYISSDPSMWGAGLSTTAYQNPSGTVVLVAVNEDKNPFGPNKTMLVEDRSSNCWFTFDMPVGVATFTWTSSHPRQNDLYDNDSNMSVDGRHNDSNMTVL